MMISNEEALFQMLLLKTGVTDRFSAWLNECLEREDPLSELTLELAFCGNNFSKAISCLHRFLTEQRSVNQEIVADRIRTEIKDRYETGKADRETCVAILDRITAIVEYMKEPWLSAYRVCICYEEFMDGYLSDEQFDKRFLSYLANGTCPSEPWNAVSTDRPCGGNKLRHFLSKLLKGIKHK